MALTSVQVDILNALIRDIKAKYTDLYGIAQTTEQLIWDLDNASDIGGIVSTVADNVYKINTLKRTISSLISQYNSTVKNVTPLPVP